MRNPASPSFETVRTSEVMWRDYQRPGRHDQPAFLRTVLNNSPNVQAPIRQKRPTLPKRQARHLAAG